MKKFTKFSAYLLALLMLAALFTGCLSAPAEQAGGDVPAVSPVESSAAPAAESSAAPAEENSDAPVIDQYGSYTTKEDVALYIYTYGCLPQNFITKDQARQAGWNGGSLEPYCPGMCIGGDSFGNREGLLPKAQGRSWTECDINTLGADSRGAERIIFSNDGLIYYTGDHYESFTLLYGQP
ncbi:MAG: ribonuclease domain-containing protein [Candidatus Limivicinus sp.]|nr:ribonuclease domain-containing protein [Candidatus Limivicinus sp.]